MTKEYVCMDCFGLFESDSHSLTCDECKGSAKSLSHAATIFINPAKPTGKVISMQIVKERVMSGRSHTLIYDITTGTARFKDEEGLEIKD